MPRTNKFLTESQLEHLTKSIARAEGYVSGVFTARAEDIVRILRKRDVLVSEDERQSIVACDDIEILDRWFDRALTVTKIDDLFS